MAALAVVAACCGQFAAAAILSPITLAWNQNPETDIAGYELSYGTTSGTYETKIDAGLNTSTQVSGLSENVTYYFVVAAYNTAGLKSEPSTEISYSGSASLSNQPPDSVISAPASNVTLTAGGSVSFSGSGTDPDGDTPLSYLWSFGSGSGISNTTSQNPGARQFNNPGTFVVSLTVTDSRGLADPSPAQRTVTVNPPAGGNQPPDSVISAPASNITITAGGSASFSGSGTDPDGNTPLSYLWSFGSGSGVSNTTSQNPGALPFNNPGTFLVSLTVTDSKGLSDPTPALRTITVLPSTTTTGGPDGWITKPATDETIIAGQSIGFESGGIDSNGNENLSFRWYFGNQSGVDDSNVRNPVKRTFEKPGTYVVTLTVYDSNGVSDPSPATRTITVLSPQRVVPRTGWTLHFVDSQEGGYEGSRAFDGNQGTMWHTQWQDEQPPPPHEIQIDLGSSHMVNGFRYLPRQDGSTVGNIAKYQFYVSTDGKNWGRHVASGRFPEGSSENEILFPARSARFVRLVSLGDINNSVYCSVAELTVLEAP